MSWKGSRRRSARAAWILALATTLGSLDAARAQSTVLRTRRPPSEIGSALHPLTIGAAIEVAPDSGESIYNLPLTIDYSLSRSALIHVEPNFVYLDRKQGGGDSGGLGDLEASLDVEFLPERRFTPSATAQLGTRLPTASRAALGDPGVDLLLGLGLDKDLVFFEMGASLVYSFATSARSQDTFEASLAVEIPVRERFAVEAELVQTTGIGGRQGEDLSEGTVAWAWRANPFATLEQGLTFASDGTWEVILGFQYSFAGD